MSFENKQKLSTRNQLQATVTSVEKHGLISRVIMEIDGQSITTIVTDDATSDLGLIW